MNDKELKKLEERNRIIRDLEGDKRFIRFDGEFTGHIVWRNVFKRLFKKEQKQ